MSLTTINRVRITHRGCMLVAVLAITACGSTGPTVGFIRPEANYSAMPVETVRSVASELEQFVANEQREPTLNDRADFVLDTPEVRQAMRSRAARYHLVQELLDTGHTMEQRNGKISILRSGAYKDSTTRRIRDRHALIVISENRDRMALYEALQEANNLAPDARVAIEEIFAQERFSRLTPGQKYQGESGEPVVK